MGRAAERVVESLDRSFEQPGWHMPVLESLQDITAAQAVWAPPGRHSIWMIVDHLALWKEHVTNLMRGEPPKAQGWEQGIDWQPIREPAEEAWQTALRRLRNAHSALKAEVTERSDEQLDEPFPGGKTPYSRVLQNVAAHDSYHCGQIHYIRALQGIPTEW